MKFFLTAELTMGATGELGDRTPLVWVDILGCFLNRIFHFGTEIWTSMCNVYENIVVIVILKKVVRPKI